MVPLHYTVLFCTACTIGNAPESNPNPNLTLIHCKSKVTLLPEFRIATVATLQVKKSGFELIKDYCCYYCCYFIY